MTYRIVKMHNYPTVCLAHTFGPAEYCYKRTADMWHIEVSYYMNGAVHRIEDGRSRVLPEHSVKLDFPGSCFTQSCDTVTSHCTCGIVADCTVRTVSQSEIVHLLNNPQDPEPILKPAVAEGYPEFILPDLIPPGSDAELIRRFILEIIRTYRMTDEPLRSLFATATILTMFAHLTQIALRDAASSLGRSVPPMHEQYVKKFKQYVEEHIDEPIRCDDIAHALSVTPGYLSAVVKQITGDTAVHYINRMKIAKVVELCYTYRIPLQQAGETVGFRDSHYLSRLFRKYYGVSWREWRESHQ